MGEKIVWVDRFLLFVSIALGIISIILKDADKSPIYFLFAYVFWRLNSH